MHAAYECNVKQPFDPLIFCQMTPMLTHSPPSLDEQKCTDYSAAVPLIHS